MYFLIKSTFCMHATDPTFSLLDESKTFNKTQIRDKNVPRSGKCKFFFFCFVFTEQFYCSETVIIIVNLDSVPLDCIV